MMADESHLEFLFPFNHLDNSSFNLALYELSHGPLNFNSNRLETLLFNPIEQPEYHINFVCKQISKSIGILSRTRFYLCCKTKLTLYYTLIYPYITYCNFTWSSTYVSNLNRIYYRGTQRPFSGK